MSEKARDLGIPEAALTYALTLVRDVQIKALRADIDPRALRIALLFAEITDRHFCARKLTKREMRELQEIARELYTQTAKAMRKKGGHVNGHEKGRLRG